MLVLKKKFYLLYLYSIFMIIVKKMLKGKIVELFIGGGY